MLIDEFHSLGKNDAKSQLYLQYWILCD